MFILQIVHFVFFWWPKYSQAPVIQASRISFPCFCCIKIPNYSKRKGRSICSSYAPTFYMLIGFLLASLIPWISFLQKSFPRITVVELFPCHLYQKSSSSSFEICLFINSLVSFSIIGLIFTLLLSLQIQYCH